MFVTEPSRNRQQKVKPISIKFIKKKDKELNLTLTTDFVSLHCALKRVCATFNAKSSSTSACFFLND